MFVSLRKYHDHLRSVVTGQFLRFAVVGASNTALDFLAYLALTRGLPWWHAHLVAAATASFCLAAASSFLLNNFWTFGHDAAGWHRRAPKFFAVAVGGLAWNAAILQMLIAAGMHDILAKLLATAVVMIWNFTLQKTWTFRS